MGSPGRFGIVTSTGLFAIYDILHEDDDNDAESARPTIQHSHTFDLHIHGDAVLTFFAWHPVIHNHVAITHADGGMSLLDIPDKYMFESPDPQQDQPDSSSPHKSDVCGVSSQTLPAHNDTAWVVSILPSPSYACHHLLSGGDDCALHVHSLFKDQLDTVWTDHKSHAAGVTAILPLIADVVAAGSFDDTFRLLRIPLLTGDLGAGSRAQVLDDMPLGGGVWRLNLVSGKRREASRSFEGVDRSVDGFDARILACCMYAGAYILDISTDNVAGERWDVKVVAHFNKHESMVYGGDHSSDGVYASCSFYDKRVNLWTTEDARCSNSALQEGNEAMEARR